MTERMNIQSGSPWEEIVGYCRATRVGNLVFVAGTTASDENGTVIGVGDMYAQTKYILNKIEVALNKAGASMRDVVRTRMFVTDMAQWEMVAKAHHEVFHDIRPVATMIEVTAFTAPNMLIEVEVDAVVTD